MACVSGPGHAGMITEAEVKEIKPRLARSREKPLSGAGHDLIGNLVASA